MKTNGYKFYIYLFQLFYLIIILCFILYKYIICNLGRELADGLYFFAAGIMFFFNSIFLLKKHSRFKWLLYFNIVVVLIMLASIRYKHFKFKILI